VRRHPQSIGAFDAKTNLSQILERVSRGEEFVITRHGRPVARLVPAETPAVDAAAVDAALRRLGEHVRDLARGPVTAAELRSFVGEGRA
jgi:prevent-host-death family protein